MSRLVSTNNNKLINAYNNTTEKTHAFIANFIICDCCKCTKFA